ncbi:hypothetical protein BDK51DRAFT_21296, partial [Blyttiomyces helicus]
PSARYFDFFPVDASIPNASRYGTVPVWGLATVLVSRHEGIAVGERLYGYFPLASHVVVVPSKKVADSFFYVDRPQLPADRKVYNQVFRSRHDPFHSPAHESHMLLLRPLFFTSYLLADKLLDEKIYNAKTVLITSASSKTSLCLAFLLKRAGVPTIGITSPSSLAWLAKTGAYPELLPYDALKSPAPAPAKMGNVVLADVAGNEAVVADVERWVGSRFVKGLSVGMSHWESRRDHMAEKMEVFFAPSQTVKKQSEIGTAALARAMGKAFADTLESADAWVELERVEGADATLRVWRDLVKGKADPRKGFILSL